MIKINRVLITLLIVFSICAANNLSTNCIRIKSSIFNKGIDISGVFVPHDNLLFGLGLGLSSNFIESAWNDFTMKSMFTYLFNNSKKVNFPVTVEAGFIAGKNYDYHIIAPYAAVNSGIEIKLGKNHKNRIGIWSGYRYGKRSFIVNHKNQFGEISYVENFKVFPFAIGISYSYDIHPRKP